MDPAFIPTELIRVNRVTGFGIRGGHPLTWHPRLSASHKANLLRWTHCSFYLKPNWLSLIQPCLWYMGCAPVLSPATCASTCGVRFDFLMHPFEMPLLASHIWGAQRDSEMGACMMTRVVPPSLWRPWLIRPWLQSPTCRSGMTAGIQWRTAWYARPVLKTPLNATFLIWHGEPDKSNDSSFQRYSTRCIVSCVSTHTM